MIDSVLDRPLASSMPTAPTAPTAKVTLEPELKPESSPARIVLVDGFNVLHTVLLKREREAGWWRRTVREKLLRRVQAWPGVRDEIWVAFDGSEPAWSVWTEPVARPYLCDVAGAPAWPDRLGPIVHSVYVESADDWIVRRARRAVDPAQTIVVSADRKVAGRARSAGCTTWTPWAFMAEIPDETASSPVP